MTPDGGRGAVTDDGCPVEVYLHFPDQGEAALVHGVIAPGASVLDLGCGTGRITRPLLALGHPVIAVDASAEMLAHVRGAQTVHSTAADLELDVTVDAVLLASHLINTVDDDARRAFLEAAARHLEPGGLLVAEQYPPSWFDTVQPRSGGHIGAVGADLTDVVRDGDVVTATIVYRIGDDQWRQTFSVRRLDDAALHRELRDAGLAFVRWLDADHDWFVAERTA